jgi:hypothetical protein
VLTSLARSSVEATFASYRARATRDGIDGAECGSVLCVQRFGSLNLNVRFHGRKSLMSVAPSFGFLRLAATDGRYTDGRGRSKATSTDEGRHVDILTSDTLLFRKAFKTQQLVGVAYALERIDTTFGKGAPFPGG